MPFSQGLPSIDTGPAAGGRVVEGGCRAEMQCCSHKASPALTQALQRARVESRAGADRTEAQRMLRETILAAERDKARAMGADQVQRGRQEEEEREQLAELEAQRRQVVVGVVLCGGNGAPLERWSHLAVEFRGKCVNSFAG